MPGRGAEHAVQPRALHHVDDRPDAAARLADEQAHRPVELDLGRRVRAVAQLVLEPLDAEDVAHAAGQHPRHEEAGQPLVERSAPGMGEHEEAVRHRRGAEPLVPRELVAVAAHVLAGVVPARTSEPPCFSVIAMPISALPFSSFGSSRGS